MYSVTPYLEHGPGGAAWVAPWPAAAGISGSSRLPFEAFGARRCVQSRLQTQAGVYLEIHWPDVMGEQITYPPTHGAWRRDGPGWVAYDATDPAQAAMLVREVPDPPEALAAKHAAMERRLAALEAQLRPAPP